MFYPIVKIEVGEVEGVLAVAPVEHVGSEIGDEEAESWREIVCRPDQGTEFIKLDIFPVAGQYS